MLQDLFPPTAVMTLIDIFVLGAVVLGLSAVLKSRELAGKGNLTLVVLLLVLGQLLIAGVYAVDLAAMYLLPSIIGPEDAMGFMAALHIRYSWYLHLIGFALLLLGFLMLLRGLRREARALSVARKRAEEANRSKSRFMADVCHELRTPLNAILGYAEVLESDLLKKDLPSEYREYAANIRTAGGHLLTMTDDLIDSSRIELGNYRLNFELVDTANCINDAATITAHEFSKRSQALEVKIPDGTPLIKADEKAVRQIVINLLSNASKYSPLGSTARLTAEVEGDYVRIIVSDQGKGIPKEELENVFEPFERLEAGDDRSTGGFGLGLSVVRRLVQGMEGKVRLESEIGKGTTVTIDLPLARTGRLPVSDTEGREDFEGKAGPLGARKPASS